MTEFPLIYCNGDSYSAENYHESLNKKTYANIVANHCNGFVINKAITGSCNRRIVRTTTHDIIHQRQLNPHQKIIVLIGLSFELRSELWLDEIIPQSSEETQFKTHVFSQQLNWKENLLTGNDIQTPNQHRLNSRYLKK